jgi:hypothetical protein
MDSVAAKAEDEFPGNSNETRVSEQLRLKLLHRRLMTVYVHEIERAQAGRRSPWLNTLITVMTFSFVGIVDEDEISGYRLGAVARALVESHVKGKLRELISAYTHIEQSVSDLDPIDTFRVWLRDTQESLVRFSATLTAMSFFRKIAAALWPLVVALVAVSAIWTTLFRVLGKDIGRPSALESFAWLAFIIVVYIGGGLSSATKWKRQLFLIPISIQPAWGGASEDPLARRITAPNVYSAEDDLFNLIGTPKQPEPALDAYLSGTVCCLGAAGVGLLAAQDYPHDWVGLVINGLFTVVFLITGIYRLVSSYKRSPR